MARAVAALEEDEAAKSLGPLLEDESPDVRRGAIEALLRYAGVAGAMAAGETLRLLAASRRASHRVEAAEVVAAVALPGYTGMLRSLLADTDLGVRRAALGAIGRTRNLRLLPDVIAALGDREVRVAATRALVAAGGGVLPSLDALLSREGVAAPVAISAAAAAGSIGGAEGAAILRKHVGHPAREVRARVVGALRITAYREPAVTAEEIRDRLAAEVAEATLLAAARVDLEEEAGAGLLRAALDRELARSRDLVLSLLALIYPAQPILWARRHLAGLDEDKRAYALEVVETVCPKRVRDLFLPLLETSEPAELLRRLGAASPPARMPVAARVAALAAGGFAGETRWLRTCAQHTGAATQNGDPMKLTVEKVILLKATDFFSTIEDDILAEVATTLVEQVAAPGERIIEQGERDSSLFVVVAGMLRVHDGATIVARLGTGEVVGDLSALVPDVRSVSVTAEEETSLLRMDHSTLMDLIEEHTEVAYGIIRFLVRRCRSATASVVRATVEARDVPARDRRV
jgi:HEAT repeat protein